MLLNGPWYVYNIGSVVSKRRGAKVTLATLEVTVSPGWKPGARTEASLLFFFVSLEPRTE